MAKQTNFRARVDDIVKRNKLKVDALIRQSVQDVIDDAQTPVAKGGRMRVDTGFLRASGQLSLTGMPSGPERGDPKKKYEPAEQNVQLTLAKVKAGDTLYFGWSAKYAAPREARDGFLAGALQNWQAIVARNVEKLK